MPQAPTTATEAEVLTCLRVLDQLLRQPEGTPNREQIERRAARIYKRARKERRKLSVAPLKPIQPGAARPFIASDSPPSTVPPPPPSAEVPPGGRRGCYVCGVQYDTVHPRYRLLCSDCAALNEEKREQRSSLAGRRALVTGGRIKIGFEVALKLLRDGAEVIVTTRRAESARPRFAQQPDSAEWQGRLHVASLDLRELEAVERFGCGFRERWGHLDILIHNAAQSVVRPDGSDEASADGREVNSWTQRLEDVEREEVQDAFTVNAAAPVVLTGRLLSALRSSPHPDRYVISVVGHDGQFGCRFKSERHPHVNASKAALNMMTRTCAASLVPQGIYLSSVDPGWVTHEGSHSARERARALGFSPPLDAVDGAARIYDPVVMGLGGRPSAGVLLRNYAPAPW